jgi:hypothetical protein
MFGQVSRVDLTFEMNRLRQKAQSWGLTAKRQGTRKIRGRFPRRTGPPSVPPTTRGTEAGFLLVVSPSAALQTSTPARQRRVRSFGPDSLCIPAAYEAHLVPNTIRKGLTDSSVHG